MATASGRIKAVSIREWLNSDEGKHMCAGVAHGQYLENRLWRAYMAGWDAAVAAMPTPRAGRKEKVKS